MIGNSISERQKNPKRNEFNVETFQQLAIRKIEPFLVCALLECALRTLFARFFFIVNPFQNQI